MVGKMSRQKHKGDMVSVWISGRVQPVTLTASSECFRYLEKTCCSEQLGRGTIRDWFQSVIVLRAVRWAMVGRDASGKGQRDRTREVEVAKPPAKLMVPRPS